MHKVGILGCGTIGSEICHAIDRGDIKAELIAVYDRNIPQAKSLIKSLRHKPEILDIERMASCVNIIVESASAEAVRQNAQAILNAGCNLMVMSVGALADKVLLDDLKRLASEKNARIYIPSGAIAGIDGIKSASCASILSVTLITRKPPGGLKDAPYVSGHGFDLSDLKEPLTLYDGPAEEAIKGFPMNVNVAATLSIAGIGPEKTRVKIIADPGIERNIHSIEVEGDFGMLKAIVENVPSPANPRTSYLAALSAIATLKKITDPLQIGT